MPEFIREKCAIPNKLGRPMSIIGKLNVPKTLVIWMDGTRMKMYTINCLPQVSVYMPSIVSVVCFWFFNWSSKSTPPPPHFSPVKYSIIQVSAALPNAGQDSLVPAHVLFHIGERVAGFFLLHPASGFHEFFRPSSAACNV